MSDERQRLDNLFSIALMLLSIIAIAEFQYVVAESPTSVKYFFWVLTYPFIGLIIAWLFKELISVKEHRKFHMFLTEFCWYLWATILYYLLNFFTLLLGGSLIASGLTSGILFGLLIIYIRRAYKRACSWMDYFTSKKSGIYFFAALLFAFGLMSFWALI